MSKIPSQRQLCERVSIQRTTSFLPTASFWLLAMNQSHKVMVKLFLGIVVSFTFSVWTSQFITFPPLRCLITTRTRMAHMSSKIARPNIPKQEFHSRQFLFIAVITSEIYLKTRARGIWRTWGKNVRGKLVFFTGRINQTELEGMPVIQLDVEDEAYPPQRKAFSMMKYVYKNFLNDFEWFVRADDDVYIRTDRLYAYLRRMDSSTDLVLGHPGTGKKEEVGLLGLGKEDNFCLGGPGIIITSGVLKKMGPHLSLCLNETASYHEDVEIGRCIRRFGGVMCPWGYQASEFFHQVYERPLEAYHGSLDTLEMEKAINLHPIKDPAYMSRIHAHFLSSRMTQLLRKKEKLSHLLKRMEPILKGEMPLTSSSQLLSNCHNQENHHFRKSSQAWEMLDFSKVWSLYDKPPLRYIHDGTEAGLTKTVDFSKEVVIRDFESSLYEAVNFDRWHTGYMRVDPKLGTELIFRLGTRYLARDGAGKVKGMRVRRSVHLRRTFGKFEIKSEKSYGTSKETLHFIVPLMERLENLKRFFKSFEEEFLLTKDPVKLLIVYFPDVSSPVEQKKVFSSYANNYPSVEMKWIDVKGPFKRAVALQVGTNYFGNNSLLYYCDVDLVFRREFADRCRANAVIGKRAYFPVMFSQFNPKVTYAGKNHPGTHFYYSKEAGFWRWYSFGPVCAYAKDINDSGGLNTDLLGWGLEDVDLYEKFIKRNDIEIFRAPDPGLVHVYHPHAACNPNSTEDQRKMCQAAQTDIYCSAESSVDYLRTKGYLDAILQ